MNKVSINAAQQRYVIECGEGYTCLGFANARDHACLLYTSPSPRDRTRSRMPSSA